MIFVLTIDLGFLYKCGEQMSGKGLAQGPNSTGSMLLRIELRPSAQWSRALTAEPPLLMSNSLISYTFKRFLFIGLGRSDTSTVQNRRSLCQ